MWTKQKHWVIGYWLVWPLLHTKQQHFCIRKIKTMKRQCHTYLKARPSKTGVKGSLNVWHSDMAVSKRPAWTKRVTISSADELPMEMEKHHSVQPEAYANEPPNCWQVSQNNNEKLYRHLACHVHYPALKCAAGTDRLMHSYLQQQLLTAHAEPVRGALEPKSTLSPGLPGPGFQSADSLSAKDKQFQFSKYKGSAYEANPTCQFPLNIK